MARLFLGALICICLATANGCAPAAAGVPASSRPSRVASNGAEVPAAWESLLAMSFASETSTYVDLPSVDTAEMPTAVYDIMAHVVVLPGGDRLEAHSGLGDRVDDPRFVAQHMRGATPPALYDLAPRRRPFHGVAALRLAPVAGDVFGRTGLLAHTYMLHGRPESNGCVVFRDYAAFLGAFREGRIRRLRVVPSVGDAGTRLDIVRAGRPTA